MKLTRGTWLSITLVSLALLGLAYAAATQPGKDMVEPKAGTWKTWVLASGSELRLPAPPDAAATKAELAELKGMAAQHDAATLERIRYWDFWSPAHRWNEMLTDTAVAQNLGGPDGFRAFTMLNVAIHDALI